MQTVFISILHYNSTKDTIACLDALLLLEIPEIRIEVYILDNGSKEEFKINEKDYLKLNLTVSRSNLNTGFTGGHNLIYEKVQDKNFDYFLILNNDSIVEKNAIKKMVDAARQQNVGAVVPKIYFTKGYEFHKDRYSQNETGKVFWYAGGYMDWDNVMSKHRGVDLVDVGQFDQKEEIDFASGACMLIKKEVIRKIGFFDERYFLYFEDADLSQRILRSGFKLIYQPEAILWHNNAGSSGSGSELHDYFLTRNRMLFGMKFAPIRIKLLLMKESMRLLLSGRKWQRIGIRDFFLHKFGKGSYK